MMHHPYTYRHGVICSARRIRNAPKLCQVPILYAALGSLHRWLLPRPLHRSTSPPPPRSASSSGILRSPTERTLDKLSHNMDIVDSCSNCLLHGWNQVEDLTTLQRCKRCKVIKYCGRDCQREHWEKVHKKQCKYFADPAKAQQWDHREENCVICLQSAVVGMSRLRRPDNPNYACIFEDFKKFPSHVYHPHPFPITGVPGDTYEKGIIVLWQLMEKFRLTQPGVVSNCGEELAGAFANLALSRLFIWRARKISPRSQIQISGIYSVDLLTKMKEKVERSGPMSDPFELWKIILLISEMLFDVYVLENLNLLINPLVDMPTEFHAIVSRGINNSAKFLDTTHQVLDALSTQVIPFRDVLKIICGGSLEQTCTFCSKKVIIANEALFCSEAPFVRFTPSWWIYCCEGYNCIKKFKTLGNDYQFDVAVQTAVQERGSTRCDFCLKLPTSAAVHRCSRCLSVMYCSIDCRDQDVEIHKEICKEGVEERKKKFGGSGRRKEAREALEKVQKRLEEENIQEACEVVGKFKLKSSTKKS